MCGGGEGEVDVCGFSSFRSFEINYVVVEADGSKKTGTMNPCIINDSERVSKLY